MQNQLENQKGRYLSQNQQGQRSINKTHLPKKKITTKTTNKVHKLPKFVSPLKHGEENGETIKYNRNKNSYVLYN